MADAHPYLPTNIKFDRYEPNNMDVLTILAILFGGLTVIVPTLAALSFSRYKAGRWRKLGLCWLLFSGCIHTFLEGHFAYFHSDLASRMDLLSQVWKEYAKSDSRYLTQDTFVVSMEIITAVVDGPLCFLSVWSFVTNHCSRYLLQLIVSLFQLYGCILYFFTEWMEDFIHGPKYHPLYFWFYFFFMNFLWIVIPSVLVLDSCINLIQAQQTLDRSAKGQKSD